ncbi:hypothetical protein JCM19300_4631 [Algibacter lectus]|uniref:Uncharacterized protein n=1 Tax=Algibacter lectus TaxID=221126 RepID=A0A090WXG5_9FLAO|nr:hypothetical protein JCM19300_4631 [Algibacter lectus]GAL81671.1 hypothetical protein JCM19274_516 [Algibacter lectus]
MEAKSALGIEALLKLFFVFLKKSDCRKPDPCGNAQNKNKAKVLLQLLTMQ